MKAKTTTRTKTATKRLTKMELIFRCLDCGMDTSGPGHCANYYMVQNALWDELVAGPGMLCIGCLEGRLGRRLRWSDFTDCPLNDIHLTGYGHRYEIDVPDHPLITRLARAPRRVRGASSSEIGGAPHVVVCNA